MAYPEARVTAVDSSPAMLDRAMERAARLGVQERVDVRLAELPDGVEGLGGADLIWASMSLHHIGDGLVSQSQTFREMRASNSLICPVGASIFVQPTSRNGSVALTTKPRRTALLPGTWSPAR